MKHGYNFVACNDSHFSCVVRPAWEETTITALHLQEVTGEELAVQALVVVMEDVLGTSQLVF
jgi:hypothetical protein